MAERNLDGGNDGAAVSADPIWAASSPKANRMGKRTRFMIAPFGEDGAAPVPPHPFSNSEARSNVREKVVDAVVQRIGGRADHAHPPRQLAGSSLMDRRQLDTGSLPVRWRNITNRG
jgi:hypothetical protein